jgi:hypothetical protein
MRFRLTHPLSALLLFTLVLTGLLTLYLTAGVEPSENFMQVASWSWALLLALWIVGDARRRAQTPCFDFGLFCYVFLPAAATWYCFWSRGWRGALTLIALLSFWLVPFIVASLVASAVLG